MKTSKQYTIEDSVGRSLFKIEIIKTIKTISDDVVSITVYDGDQSLSINTSNSEYELLIKDLNKEL